MKVESKTKAGTEDGQQEIENSLSPSEWSWEDKLKILLAELQERYAASHKIRERSLQFTLWISGMAVGLSWLLISQKILAFAQQIALTLLIVVLFGGALHFIMGLQRGFQNNRKAMITIERVLGMHEASVFLPNTPLLPPEYEKTEGKWSSHFCTLSVWLGLVTLALLILIWAHPYCAAHVVKP